MKLCGIYGIHCTTSDKWYYGSTNDGRRRKNKHFHDLRKNKHVNPHLQNAFNKYGEANFEFVWLENASIDCLVDIEQRYLDENVNGYNIATDAECPGRGRIVSENTKEKLRTVNLGKKLSEETRRKIGKAGIGRKASKDTIDKKRKSMLGRKLDEHWCENISKSKIGNTGKFFNGKGKCYYKKGNLWRVADSCHKI